MIECEDTVLEQARRLIAYDPETGVFTRRARRGRFPAGSVCHQRHSQGYVVVCVAGVSLFAHRLAWLMVHGVMPADEIDHINGIRDDNRICNLRPCSAAQNRRNQRCLKSRWFKGVKFDPRWSGYWTASIKAGKRVYLGRFASAEAAARAYDAAAIDLHGEFAATNVSLGLLPALDGGEEPKRMQILRQRLTDAQVLSIRNDGRPQRKIAAEFGVAPSCVAGIKLGRLYRTVSEAVPA